MTKIPVKQLTSWSFSRYGDYKQCPLKAKLKHIERIKEPPNEAMARGDDIHKGIEAYLKGSARALPKDVHTDMKPAFKLMKDFYKKNFTKPVVTVVEDTWAFDKDWVMTRWDDWANCVVRIKLDCALEIASGTLAVRDWKTGKFRAELHEEYLEQLELYALAAMLWYPHIDFVIPELWYVDLGTIYPRQDEHMLFRRDQVPELMKKWEKRTRPMLNDKKFPARPNSKCNWCFYGQSGKSKGGPGKCKF